MDRERADGACEKGILGLVLAILAFGPLAMGGVRAWQFLVLQGLTMGVLVLWIARLWVNRRPQLLWPPICWAVLAFVGYAVLRYFQADIEYVARKELIRILIYAFLFFAIVNNLHRQETMQIITVALLFLGMAISVYAIWQFAAKSNHVWNMPALYPGRASGTFIYPNNLAGFLEMLVPLGLAYTLLGRSSHVMKIFLGYASAVMIAGIGVSLSRGGYVAAGIAVVVFCVTLLFQRFYRIQALVILAALILAGYLVVPRATAARALTGKSVPGHSVDDLRLPVWTAAIQMWRDHFWWGVGPGHFDYRFRQYRPAGVQLRPGWAHNDYLNTLADWGVTGAALVAAAWVLLYWGVVRAWKYVRGARDDFARKKSNKLALAVGASVGLLAILAHSVVDFNFQLPANAILAVTLMALLSSQQRFASERFWWKLGMISRGVATLALAGGIAWLGYEGWRGGREAWWLHRAAQARPFSKERAALLERAFHAEPRNFTTSYEIGECYRTRSFYGETEEPEALAKQAVEWYERGIKLDPYDGYNWLRCGMCLDKFGTDEGGPRGDAAADYDRADVLDPNGYYTAANIGWHYLQTGDLAASRSWLERSRRLEWGDDNDIAIDTLPIVERLMEAAAAKNK